MKYVLKKKEITGTWLNEPAKSISYYLMDPLEDELEFIQKDTGLRVHVMVWANEDKATDITLQSGDGRTSGFKKYIENTISSKDKKENRKRSA